MCSFYEKLFLLCLYEEMLLHLKLHMKTFSYFGRWFYFLILTFYIIKQNKSPKIDPK